MGLLEKIITEDVSDATLLAQLTGRTITRVDLATTPSAKRTFGITLVLDTGMALRIDACLASAIEGTAVLDLTVRVPK